MHVHTHVYVYVHVCTSSYIDIHIYNMYIHIYIYIYIHIYDFPFPGGVPFAYFSRVSKASVDTHMASRVSALGDTSQILQEEIEQKSVEETLKAVAEVIYAYGYRH